ncbi:MAG: hypothetical protein ACKVP3_18095 [Hyphomicrobiaceae bacterium]
MTAATIRRVYNIAALEAALADIVALGIDEVVSLGNHVTKIYCAVVRKRGA